MTRARYPAIAVFATAIALTIPATAAIADQSVVQTSGHATSLALASTPTGYRATSRIQVGRGLEHLTLVRGQPDEVVHVGRIAKDAPYRLRVVVSNDSVGNSDTERTSAMCVRVGCALAINGDFFGPSAAPTGGVVLGGEAVRSPNDCHHQLVITPGGGLQTGPMSWSGLLVATDLKRFTVDGVNVPLQADRIVLYTPRTGTSTRTNQWTAELSLRTVRPAGPIRLGQTSVVEILGMRQGGNAPIPSGGAVLAGNGRGASALRDLWRRVETGVASHEALLRIESSVPVAESLGGTPILVRNGKRWFANEPRSFVRERHPRTMAGWTAAGDVMLVTVDGRQAGYSQGMSLVDAADLMIALGAVDAINLDGGGSTTFVEKGRVANRPSDRAVLVRGRLQVVTVPARGSKVLGNVERPVAVALAVVPVTEGASLSKGVTNAGLLKNVNPPVVLPVPAATADDLASNPSGGLSALVLIGGSHSDRVLSVSVALVLLVAAAALLLLAIRGGVPLWSASRSRCGDSL